MEPFQIVYLTGDGDQPDTVTIMDEILLQETTAMHLTTTMREADPNNFITLTLYHIARSNSTQMFHNGTKVGFGGTIYYSSSDRTSQEQMISSEYLSFLGRNETKYVAMLQDLGWDHLEHALLMNGLGNMVELVGDNMVERDADADADADAGASALESDGDMGKSTSMTMYLVAVLVPVSMVLLMLVSWGAYRARNHVVWNAHSSSPSNPVWHSDLHKSQSRTEKDRDAENIPHDGTSQISSNSDSVRVTVPPVRFSL